MALRRQPRLQDTESPRCGVCTAVFRLDRRRHHCRSCGDVICAECWDHEVVDVLQWEWCRVCSRCFGDLEKDLQTCIEMGVDLNPGQADVTPASESEPEPELPPGGSTSGSETIGLPATSSWEMLTDDPESELEPEGAFRPKHDDFMLNMSILC